ncbi:NAD(P)/FAD-dependent oxidoreductase [Siphonobacter sp. SORGH_AS_1065]|uniref:phytoene desaturase family protein n=1 Tax=Siphonobacter sp. SORGH_AS_1065 TaxID=3041795 RepID=UPI00277F2370|nr:phytoene desaturase family protein [Siphonobacter sp. SORGH_AS_1065]MDQ1086547.1 phytoene desaturase [Siphonobacter sp. SORGH_AS_1065]
MGKRVIVIGAGFSGLAAATALADQGYEVTILEKNESAGGRARKFETQGFVFDMGPSWYWMPDVFEKYFAQFGKKPSDYYQLIRLDPSYCVVFGSNDAVDLPASLPKLEALFEKLEPGAAQNLQKFLKQAAYKYDVGMNTFVWKPSRSITEFLSFKLLLDVSRLDVLQSFHSHIRKYFRHERILKLMEFPILFLGALPENTPAMYSLMNYAEIALGTWYPMGGMHEIVKAMVQLAHEKGVQINYEEEVQELVIKDEKVRQVVTTTGTYHADAVVAGADYHHVEDRLLKPEYRNYSESYWQKRILAPSCVLYYLGVNRRVDKLIHHNLFFDEDFGLHSHEIYTEPKWPSKPLFYVSAPSKTDPSVAPEDCENLFVLIPVAPDLEGDTEATRDYYYNMVMERLERYVGHDIRSHVVYKRSYAHSDFIQDYHAFKGNAYGLANTLSQTALLKPTLKSYKVKNLYYTGQLTVPGPGVPPSLISGLVVAQELDREQKKRV